MTFKLNPKTSAQIRKLRASKAPTIIEMAREIGEDPSTFFEGEDWSGLDLRPCDLNGVSFARATLDDITAFDDQIATIRQTGPASLTRLIVHSRNATRRNSYKTTLGEIDVEFKTSFRTCYRLIPSTHYRAPIIGNDEEKSHSSHSYSNQHSNLSVTERESNYQWANNYINAAFSYTMRNGCLLNTENKGAWYASEEVGSALSEITYYRLRELAFSGSFKDEARYACLKADIQGTFAFIQTDIRTFGDPANFPATQRLAESLIRDGAEIIHYNNNFLEIKKLVCALDPSVIKNVEPAGIYELVVRGENEILINKIDPLLTKSTWI